MQYLLCYHIGDTAVLHWTIEIDIDNYITNGIQHTG